MQNQDLVDIWGLQHGQNRQYTWHSKTSPPIFCRLDYFLISENISKMISLSKIKHGYKSDHSIVIICVDFLNFPKGPGYFKVNNSLILHTEYQTLIRKSRSDTANINADANPNILWEVIKGSIRTKLLNTPQKLKKKTKKMRKTYL